MFFAVTDDALEGLFGAQCRCGFTRLIVLASLEVKLNALFLKYKRQRDRARDVSMRGRD